MRARTLTLGAAAAWAVLAAMVQAVPASTYAHSVSQTAGAHRYNQMGESVGLVGYDPVSYFPEGGGKPQKGLISISLERDGVTYRFASQVDLALFRKDPEKYLPAYGGWCAWAAGERAKRVDIDPESFKVRDGRLYLFYRDPALDTRALWLRRPAELIGKANVNWPSLAR